MLLNFIILARKFLKEGYLLAGFEDWQGTCEILPDLLRIEGSYGAIGVNV